MKEVEVMASAERGLAAAEKVVAAARVAAAERVAERVMVAKKVAGTDNRSRTRRGMRFLLHSSQKHCREHHDAQSGP